MKKRTTYTPLEGPKGRPMPHPNRRVVVRQVSYTAYGDGPDPYYYLVGIEDRRAYLTGVRWELLTDLVSANTAEEARRQGVQLLREWADELEAGDGT